MSERERAAHGGEPAAGHELRDISFRPIVTASIGLAVVIAVVFVAMRLLFSYYAMREAATSPPPNPLAAELARGEPPLPRLQAAPIEDLRRLRQLEGALLERYSWVDREKGIVRLPIERAMELLAERGLTASPEPVSP
jgi:hypothetical protein